jgi:hypothetical protein
MQRSGWVHQADSNLESGQVPANTPLSHAGLAMNNAIIEIAFSKFLQLVG